MTTINSAIENAVDPDSLHFGIVYQGTEREKPDFDSIPNCSVISLHPKQARGAGYARHLGMSLYNNQDYYMQVDSHTLFAPRWDSRAVGQLVLARERAANDKVVLSCFPPPFVYQDNKKIVIPKDGVPQATYPTKQRPILNKRKEWTAERVEFDDLSLPEESTTVLAGLIFADGRIVSDVPYDPEISFFGEEICFAMRAWTRGWDIYSPSVILAYHFYTRVSFPKIWKDRNLRKISWTELEEISRNKQRLVLTGQEQSEFGAGNVRSLKDFEKFCGVDFAKVYEI